MGLINEVILNHAMNRILILTLSILPSLDFNLLACTPIYLYIHYLYRTKSIFKHNKVENEKRVIILFSPLAY